MYLSKYVCVAGLSLCGATAISATDRPNVVFILVDDLGCSDLNFIGHKKLNTPNIDNLVKESMFFTDAYASAPVSSPTRASILTGRYPAELKLTCHIPGLKMEKYLQNMKKDFPLGEAFFTDHLKEGTHTLATISKKGGYKNAFIGKWHLAGDGSIYTDDGCVNKEWNPENYDFDINIGGCSYGQPSSYFAPYKNHYIKEKSNGEYLTDRLGDEAVNFIEANSPEKTGKPFFLYLSFYAVHTPYQVPGEVIEQNDGNKYFALIQKMDENVGKVLQTLKKCGLDQNTVVIFYSDNGGVSTNPPFSEKKGSLKEGGIRVPLIIRWPKMIKSGIKCEIPVTSTDFFPTFCDLMKVETMKKESSGQSVYPILCGNVQEWNERAIYWHFPHNRKGIEYAMGSAIREGDWKLIYSYTRKKSFLFNLKNDPKEIDNLSEKYPLKMKELNEKLNLWIENINAEMPDYK